MGVIRKTRTKILNITTALILVANGLGAALPLSLAGTAYADSNNGDRVINSASIPSGSSTIVGLPVTASVNVTTSGGDDNFECVAWAIATSQPDNASFTAYDFAPNHTTSGTYDEQVIMTAPSSAGTYNAYFIAYGNNSCTGNGSNVYTLSNAITVTNPFNFNFTPSTPSATPAAGTYASTQNVTLSSGGLFTPINIYYTTDGSTPDCTPTGTAYASPISVSTSETIKAIACDGLKQASSVSTFDYIINSAPPAAPTPTGFTQSGGRTLACGASTNASHIGSTSLGWTLPAGETETAWRVIPTYPSGSHGTPYSWTSGTSVWIGANIGQGYGAAPNDQGLYQYSIQYKDANGVWSDPATCNLTYDSVAPTIDILSPAANSFVHGTVTIRAKITENGSGVKNIDAKFTDGASHGATPNEFGTVALHLVSGTTDTYEGQIDTTGHSGVYNVAVDAWDNANNPRSAKNQNVTIDNTVPTTPAITGFTSPTLACGDATNAHVGGIAIHWTPSNALSGIYQYAITPNYPDNHGEYTYYPNGSATSVWIGDNFGRHGDGVYSYAIKAQSKSGLWSSSSTTCTLTYDTTAPSISNIQITPTINGNIGRIVTITFDMTDTAAVDLDSTYTWLAFVNGPGDSHRDSQSAHYAITRTSGDSQSGSYKVVVNTENFVDQNYTGQYDLLIRAKDILGNAKSSEPHAFYDTFIDNSGPSVVSVDPANGSYVHGTQRITVHLKDDTGVSKVTLQLAHGSKGTGSTYNMLQGSDNNTWYYDLDTSKYTDGSYDVHIRPLDSFNTPRENTTTLNDLRIDNTAPKVQSVNLDKMASNLTSAAMNSGNNGNLQVTITTDEPLATGSEVFLGSHSGGRTSYYSLKQSGTGNTYIANVNLNDPFLAGKTISDVYLRIRTEDSLGNHTWTYYTVDSNGNFDLTGSRYYFTVDNIGPGSTNDLPAIVDGTVTVHQTVTDDTAPASGKLRIWKLDSNGQPDNSEFYASAQMNVDKSSVVTYTFDSVNNLFGDGNYIAKFTSWDTAGNGTVQQANFTVDNTGPELTYIDKTEHNNVITPQYTAVDAQSSTPLTFTWVADSSNPSGATISDSSVLNPDFTVTAGGDYKFTLTAKDSLGNSSTAVFSFTYTVPARPLTQLHQGGGQTNTPGANNGGTFTNVNGQVLGVQATTPNTPADDTKTEGQVQGDQTTDLNTGNKEKTVTNSRNFLGLGWWWLLILAAILAFLWYVFGRANSDDKKA